MPKETKPKRANKKEIVLVTGGTSGIGAALIERLLEENYEVRAVLRDLPKENPEWMLLPGGVKIYVADIRQNNPKNNKVLIEACKDVAVLFHLAAATSNTQHDYNELINTNVVGTENILRAYFDANTDSKRKLRFIYSSSVTVYGYSRKGEVLTENSEPMPKSAYSESKYMGEQVVRAFASANKRLSYTILRIGVIYGKRYEHNFMHIFRLIKEGKIRYVGNGANHLTLVHVDDVISAFFLAMENGKSENKTYNLTDGVPYPQKELFNKAAELVGYDGPIKSIHPILAKVGARTRGINTDQFKFLVSDRIVSIEKIKKELGFKPSVSIDSGGKELAKEFLAKHKNK